MKYVFENSLGIHRSRIIMSAFRNVMNNRARTSAGYGRNSRAQSGGGVEENGARVSPERRADGALVIPRGRGETTPIARAV